MKRADLEVYGRNLPHWRMPDATYFVTWRLRAGMKKPSAIERDEILRTMLFFEGQRYCLLACVVMDDHVHAMVMPTTHELEEIIHTWKSFSAHQLRKISRRNGGLWDGESFDRIIRDDRELGEKLNYIAGNPRKRWPNLASYPWLWLAPQFTE